jgi:putative MATE family efflux protein
MKSISIVKTGNIEGSWKGFMDMTEGDPVRRILWFALPLAAGNVFQQLYYLTDSAIIGRYIGINALAATSSCSWVSWTINAFSRDLSGAVSITASRAVGNSDRAALRRIAVSAVVFSVLLGLLVMAALEMLVGATLDLFQVQEQIREMTGAYMRVTYLGLPAILLFNILAAVLRAAGNSRVTFYAVSAATVLNIGLDFLFVAILHMSVRAAAAATVAAQLVSLGITAAALYKSGILSSEEKLRFIPDPEALKEILKLFFPMFANSLVISVGGSIVSRTFNGIGTHMTAGMAAGTRVFTILESVVIAVQTGMSVFVGQNLGAGKTRRIWMGVRRTVLACLGLCIATNIVLQPLAGAISGVFLSETDPALYLETHAVAALHLHILIIGLFIMTPMYLYRITVQALGHAEIPLYTAFLQLQARIAAVLFLPMLFGEIAYYLPTVLAWIVTLPVVYLSAGRLMKNL